MTKRSRPWGYQDPGTATPPNWELHPDTVAVRGGLSRTGFGETGEALFLNSGFTYDSAEQAESAFKEQTEHFLYSRFGNPTNLTFENRIAAIEGSEAALSMSTGMSAMFASVACLVQAGDHIVASASMFSSCYVVLTEILPKWGVTIELVEGNDKKKWAAALAKPTKVVFLETPSNPLMEIVDIRMVSDLAHKVGATVIVDNVLASPVLQKPLELGADVVMYSATKHIDGQGRVLGGVVCGTKHYIYNVLRQFTRHTGQSMGSFEAWVLTKSLETMSMRVNRMSDTALEVATFLEAHAKVASVRYPFLKSHPDYKLAKKQMTGGGSTIGINFKGNKDKVFKFMNALQVIDISNNLGDSKSLMTHPSSTTHRRLSLEVQKAMNITETTVRLSVGLEHPQDLIKDLETAFKAMK
jgi:O-succinylhomoserine sulfhydrylase